MFNFILGAFLATFGLMGATTSVNSAQKIDYQHDGKVVFLEGEDAINYAKNYGIDDYLSVDSVYVTVNAKCEENVSMPYYFGNDYYIDKNSIEVSYEKGDLIRRSQYFHPCDATMTVSEVYNATFSFNFEIGTDELKAKLGYTKSTTFTISDSFTIHLKEGESKAISCYQNIEKKTFDVWEDDIWFDDLVGNYYSMKPIGCSFFVTNL